MKKLITLILLLTGMASTASADTWTLRGAYTEDNEDTDWSTVTTFTGTPASCTRTLNANSIFYFKIVKDGSTWYGNGGSMYFYNDLSSGWTFDGSSNCNLYTEFEGDYTFTLKGTNASGQPIISVTYPDKTTTIYFYNNLSWTAPYLYTLKTAYWNNDKGSGASGRPSGIAMSQIGTSNIWKADVRQFGGFVAFVENVGGNPENFWNTEAVYRGDYNLSSSGSLFVPNASGETETKNSTKYYKEGAWHSGIHTRENLTAGKFGTICLPFDATIDSDEATVFRIVSKVMDGSTLKGINLESVSTLTAGQAYIFKAKGSTFTATIAGNEYNASASTAGGMTGTFSELTNIAAGNYIIKDNLLRKVAGSPSYVDVPAYRAYITLTGINPAAARGPLFIEFEDESAGIEDIRVDNNPNSTIYNLQGQRVTDNQKGLLIINGKKVLRK